MPSYIKKVAIVGATGNIGHHILTSLLARNNHSITALTRMDSDISLPSSVTVFKVDYNDITTLTHALFNHDIFIITLSVTTPPSVHSNLVTAASAAGIRYIIPNAYGFDFRNPSLIRDIPAASLAHSYFSQIEKLGMVHFSLVCGFWYEWSLGVASFYGIDIAAKKVVFYDDGETKMNTSTWEACGDAVAGIVGLPIEELETKWRNKSFYVSSFRVSQREMLESVQRVLGQGEGEWEVECKTSKERFKRSIKEMREGDHMAFARAMYARVFYPDGSGDYESSHGLDNQVLDLPSEDLDTATRKTIEMVNSGWNPFA